MQMKLQTFTLTFLVSVLFQATAMKHQLQQEKTQSALEKAQSDFDRFQEKFERAENDTRRVRTKTAPSLLFFLICGIPPSSFHS